MYNHQIADGKFLASGAERPSLQTLFKGKQIPKKERNQIIHVACREHKFPLTPTLSRGGERG